MTRNNYYWMPVLKLFALLAFFKRIGRLKFVNLPLWQMERRNST